MGMETNFCVGRWGWIGNFVGMGGDESETGGDGGDGNKICGDSGVISIPVHLSSLQSVINKVDKMQPRQ